MAKRLFTTQNLTWTQSNAGTAIGTSSTYMAIKGGNGTQIIDVLEVLISGMASASTVAALDLARANPIEVGAPTIAAPHSDGGMNPSITLLSSANTPVVFDAAATTQPTPSNTVTDAKLNLGLNLFGGILRWNAAPTQQWWVVGNTAPGGETVLWNNGLGGGAAGLGNVHIMYEPY
jgi:hypothetical protein